MLRSLGAVLGPCRSQQGVDHRCFPVQKDPDPTTPEALKVALGNRRVGRNGAAQLLKDHRRRIWSTSCSRRDRSRLSVRSPPHTLHNGDLSVRSAARAAGERRAVSPSGNDAYLRVGNGGSRLNSLAAIPARPGARVTWVRSGGVPSRPRLAVTPHRPTVSINLAQCHFASARRGQHHLGSVRCGQPL